MSMMKEFKDFAMRGNVVDMAVGIVIGGAFGKIVSSFVGDVIMPVIGKLTGGLDFSQLYINLSGGEYETLAAAKEAGAATLNYGAFINVVVDFVIIAFAIFIAIKAMNAAKRKEEEAPAAPTSKKCGECLMEIPIEAKRCGHCTSAVTA
jgi:large conductance mechanosensitive channel